ncbi:hypothetical protein SLS53_007607 [Cytospora paraplurivora]|uniref:Uncharacterized protein n=1 Tax=Cytospora paraplurivora TaxID=2898453 RepID=A0AAN9YDR9_9PEZI
MVASASDERRVRVLDVQMGNMQQVFDGFTGFTHDVAMSRATRQKNRVILAAFDETRIKSWNVIIGEALVDFPCDTEDEDVYRYGIASSPAADKLAAARSNGISVWNMPSFTSCVGFAGDGDSVNCVEFSPGETDQKRTKKRMAQAKMKKLKREACQALISSGI